MKGVVLAGGTGSRLGRLTTVTNKHLLPVGRLPMIFYPLNTVRQCGIRDVMIVTGREHMGDVFSLLGSGSEFSMRFTYRVQDRAGGIAEAISLTEDFVGDDKVMVVLGDNIFQDNLSQYADEFRSSTEYDAMLLLKEVDDANRFGVADIRNGTIADIIEKPKKPPSRLAVTGAYFYTPVIFPIISSLEPSSRGELEITDLNRRIIHTRRLTYRILDGFWSDAGTFESLHRANQFIHSTRDWRVMT